ncbi:MAG TPA: hypothetical protein VGN11_11985 [Candidatus Baltobacteraceae bacterium]|nr:hypothetical protein [Candidatus Baltobacteraceae bacterium]
MYTDARIKTALEILFQAIDAPPVSLADIRRKISQPQPVVRHAPPYARLAFAAAAVIAALVVTLPSMSPAFVETIEARYRAALQALGGIAPPSAPQSVIAKLVPQITTLAAAQSRVRFTIVPPSGLPSDVVSSAIQTTPEGVYSKETRSWRVGSSDVIFAYRRAGGREFILLADHYDAHGELPSKYMFEAKNPTAGGRPVLVKHEQFAWRNGDQLMTATEGSQISAAEILAIQTAMHGIAVPRRELHTPETGMTMKLRVFKKP